MAEPYRLTRVNAHSPTGAAVERQAAELETLLPRLMRRLFTLDPEHPTSDLPVAQMRVVSELQAGPRTPSALSDDLRISMSAVTQLVDRLEKAGIVQRCSGTPDRRSRPVQLTARGATIMQSRRDMRVGRALAALERLEPRDRERLLAAISGLLNAADMASGEAEEPAGAGARGDAGAFPDRTDPPGGPGRLPADGCETA